MHVQSVLSPLQASLCLVRSCIQAPQLFGMRMESPDLLCFTVQKLKGQVTSLKASRDKLLAEVDRQSTEADRLLTHNATLEQVSFSPPACFASSSVR